MNGRMAKALRRESRKATKGLPEVAYDKEKDSVTLGSRCTRSVNQKAKTKYKEMSN